MKNFKQLILALLAVTATISATAATAKLKGKVVDKSTNEPLIGATVMVKGTTKGVTTDVDGSFELDLESKRHTLSVSYVSYTTQELEVEAKTKSPDVMVLLEADAQLIDAVRVTARVNRSNEFAAIADQRNAIVATQVVGVQELSRKGVGDAQGAVMKVSGISKQEGVKNVFVRGLGDRYNSTTLNGLPIPSEDPEYKNISLDFFSTDIIQSVNVSKAFFATGNSDVGGANIDITSKQLAGDGELSVSVSGGVNTQTIGADVMKMDGVNAFGFANNNKPTNITTAYGFENKLDPTSAKANFDRSVGISGGKRFEVAGNPLTFYAVAAYDSGTSYIEEDVRSTDTSGEINRDQLASKSEINTSYLGLANINYSIGDKHTIDYNFMYVHSSSQSVGYYNGYDNSYEDKGGYTTNNGILVRQQANDNTMYINQIISKWTLASRLELDVAGSYNKIVGLEPDRRVNLFGLETDGTYTAASKSDNHTRFFSELREDDANIQAAVSYALSDNKENKSVVKLGYAGRFVNNNFHSQQYNMNDVTDTYVVTPSNIGVDNLFNTENLLNGDFIVLDKDINSYEVTKSVHSAYAELTYELSKKLIANVGLKYDMVNINVDADLYVPSTNSGNVEESFFLPSLNLRYALNDNHSVRLSASKTYTLPQAKELSPYNYSGANFNSQGNPNLRPSDNYNVDIKWDWYISSGELFSVTGFYKHIVDPIARIDKGSASNTLTYENIADFATAAGVEIEFRKNLLNRELGRDKSNRLSFGLNGSYIYTNAKVDNPLLNANVTTGSQLEGAAPWIVNSDLSLQLKRGEKVFTNTIIFNFTSDKVYNTGTNGYNDIIEKSVSKLDFVSSAKLNQKLSLSLKASNLLNPEYVLERESSNSSKIVELSNYKKGVDISLGLSVSF